jgi:beta-lactamase regulating signal transducer with metallopeptidase domain
VLRAARPSDIAAPMSVKMSATLLEPGLVGIFRATLLLPDSIAEKLTMAEFQSIIAHEACHMRRRDNLWAALHMLVEAIFWFWPPVWWLGARLIAERERACDEAVLAAGNEPQTYAESILKVCKHYV